MVIEDLSWLGLEWSEGPDHDTLQDRGSLGPYRQSHRREIYSQVAQQLLDSGQAYYCFLTEAEIESQREKALKASRPPHVESPYQDWPIAKALEKIQAGDSAVVRFRTRNLRKDYVLKDMVRR